MKEKNYEDIINLPHHVLSVHPHMSMVDRAAQFAPFAALSGYDEVLKKVEKKAKENTSEQKGDVFYD